MCGGVKTRDNSGPQSTWPNPYPSKERSLLSSAQFLIIDGLGPMRDSRNSIMSFIIFLCKKLYHIGKVSTEYVA